ncbi:MAG: aminotransferase class IV [Proteobacteria bacterium]|nr:aminotransferase class IV [Pseudomonadota bacterium]
MSNKVYINGDIVNADKAKISVSDPGLNYGYGLFETMQAYNGQIFLFDEHLKKLSDGAAALSIRSHHLKKFAKSSGRAQIGELLKANKLTTSNAYIKIVVTKGQETKNATIIIFAKATEEAKNKELRKRGVKAILTDEPNRYRPDIKSLNYMANIEARAEARKNQAYDAIFKSRKDKILEGSATNIFIVKDKRLITPKATGEILPGITRDEVIRLATANGLKVEISPIKTGELLSSDEAFLTNSIIEQVPVVKVDSRTIGNGKPGEITRKIQALYYLARGGK